ncbi:MAG: WYL domain-containing protein [Gammaproteobacteria bacterium]|nr:WYL domain-containing protein [Gammaproteobacteria bacterium]
MDKFDRIYALHRILSTVRYPVPRTRIEEELECERVTVGRIINYMRSFLGAPIAFDAKNNGYYYDRKEGNHFYELPGLWFNAGELQALAILSQLIRDIQPGLLEDHLRPFQKRIEVLLANRQFGNGEFTQRIRVLGMGVRNGGNAFQKVAEGILQRKQLSFQYHARTSDEVTHRTVSPQRLIHYRDNWYLDAYCHLRNNLRSFSIDKITQINLIDQKTKEIDNEMLEEYFADAYGIFSGKADKVAVLHFTPNASRWVGEERWHPRQTGKFLESGDYELRIPYGKSQELIMDILKYGPDVEVIAPDELRLAVKERLAEAAGLYEG